jgi:hypothetical protein
VIILAPFSTLHAIARAILLGAIALIHVLLVDGVCLIIVCRSFTVPRHTNPLDPYSAITSAGLIADYERDMSFGAAGNGILVDRDGERICQARVRLSFTPAVDLILTVKGPKQYRR